MGNEMGNNNTTGLSEEENLRVEDAKELLLTKEISLSVDEDVKQEKNHVVTDFEANDFLESVDHFSVDNKTPINEDKEESVDFPLDNSPKVEASLKEESSEIIDNQQQDSLSNEAEDESVIELNMNEIVPNHFVTHNFPSNKGPEKPDQSENGQHRESTTTETSSMSGSTENNRLPETEDSDNVESSVVTETIDVSKREIGPSSVEKNEESEEGKDLSEDELESVTTEPNEPIESEEKFIGTEFNEEFANEFESNEVSEDDDHQSNDVVYERSESKIEQSDETSLDSKSLVAKMIVSMNELAFDTIKQCVEKPDDEAISSETTKVSSRDSVERSSTDSDRDSVQYAQMRKSPSFSVDLQNEEESDQTPLLYEDKAEIHISPRCENDVISLGNSLTMLNGQEMVVEEKVVELERSASEKLKTTFLGFVREEEEEESHIVVVTTPTRQEITETEDKNVNNVAGQSIKVTISSNSSSSSKGKEKEKRKVRSSLFGNCMCCATVIN